MLRIRNKKISAMEDTLRSNQIIGEGTLCSTQDSDGNTKEAHEALWGNQGGGPFTEEKEVTTLGKPTLWFQTH